MKNVTFDEVRRGYDPTQVQTYITLLQSSYEDLQEKCEDAETEAASNQEIISKYKKDCEELKEEKRQKEKTLLEAQNVMEV